MSFMTSPLEPLRVLQKTGLLFMHHKGISHFCFPCLDSQAARPRPSSTTHSRHKHLTGTTNASSAIDDLFSTMTTATRDTVSGQHQHHGFGLPDFGKFPSSVAAANVGFNDVDSNGHGGPGD
ncbi:hypothetical protein K443DRAFT_2095 [Laccaria amethystina LaAM-08-1]|uniref:Unplaced genomic scaffold K443scaffold_10, whole genome shotgun sequence n=1 Tax=Laccaria amethystina LaAM-08-1 TaxID=1095629 RepID=A0A0C9YC44_9AGAR|nr:hypothetical protein K443DRAFT_2095 [Laccaria amethystina LaAM-08-1]